MDIRLILVQAFVILFAITVHEAAHAWTANRSSATRPRPPWAGPPSIPSSISTSSARSSSPCSLFSVSKTGGRSPVFGWAKPVPYNPQNLRHPRKGGLWISFAGPIANILTAAAAVVIFQLLKLGGAAHPRSPRSSSKPLGGLVIILYTRP